MKNSLGIKLQSRALSLLVIIALMSFGVSASFAVDSGNDFNNVVLQGSGSLEIPYQIDSCEKLQAINEHPNRNYILSYGIDCTGSAAMNNGQGFIPIDSFSGDYFDGRNYTINGLTIAGDTEGSLGLFKNISAGSTVSNIRFTSLTVTNNQLSNVDNITTGTLAGVNHGTIDNIDMRGTYTSAGFAGGLVGANYGTISRVKVAASTHGTSAGFHTMGGIAGYNTGSISDSFASADLYSTLSEEATCGGLAGSMQNGSISKSYTASVIECPGNSNYVGGLVGTVTGSATITDSFVHSAPNHAHNFNGAIVGYNDGPIDLSSTYFDAVVAEITNCDSNGTVDCHAVNTVDDNYDSNYFYNNTSNAPLNNWNFDTTWTMRADATPDLNINRDITPLSPTSSMGDVQSTTAVLNWDPAQVIDGAATNGTPVTGYEIIYTTNASGDVATMDDNTWNVMATVSPEQLTYTATELDPATRYDFRVRAINNVGAGLPSYPLTVISTPAVVAAPTSPGSLSKAVGLQWEDRSSTATDYVVQYKKTSDSDWTTYTRSYFPDPATIVYPLDEETSYDFRVASINSRGTSAYSDSATFTTTLQASYTISTCEDLQNMSEDPYGHYTLANDIDCSASADWNNGQGFVPIGGLEVLSDALSGTPFTGTLDGAGHKITNLTMNRPGAPAGLFMSIDGATIKDLTFDGGQIAGTRANDGTVYTDLIINPVVGTLAAVASNSVIDNVDSNIDLPSDPVYGLNGGAGGLVGIVMPSIFGFGTATTNMTITNSDVSGDVDGMVSGNLVGASILINLIKVIMLATQGSGDFEQYLSGVGTGMSMSVTDSTASGKVECLVICGGAVGLSIGDLSLNNVTRTGDVGGIGASSPSTGPQLDQILAMIIMSGPLSGGLVGGSLPISLDGGVASLDISNSSVAGSVTGTLSGGVVGLGLPAISVDLAQIISTGGSPDMQTIMGLVLGALSGLLSNDALTVSNVDVTADVTCTVACGGAIPLSLGKTILSNLSMTGDVTNDNAPLIDSGHPISYCPAQITGGLVGAQVLFPLDVTNSDMTGNIEVNQAGVAPSAQLIDLLTADFNDDSFVMDLICGAASNAQGTGGIVGSFISPINITGVVETLLQLPAGTFKPFGMNISNSHMTGAVDSNAYSATGGLAGFIIGKSTIDSSYASGNVSNSTFAEMFRTPISSASTGGLVGRMLGGYEVSGNPIPIIMFFMGDTQILTGQDEWGNNQYDFNTQGMHDAFAAMKITSGYATISNSHASGNVYSSNSAGGLVGNVAGITKIQKSFATGDVYGTAAGGLIGSGFNMGSLLGALNLFSSIELDNTYARGDVYALDDPNTVTFAGGLVGMMAHFGEFKIDHSYATGKVAVKNNATNTRLVAGGLVGAELDLGIVPTGLLLAFATDENVLPNVLSAMDALGLEIKQGVTVSNSFTTSSVPAKSSGKDDLIKEIALGNPGNYKTTGSLFGFVFSLDYANFPEFPYPAEGESLDGAALMQFIQDIHWQSTDTIVSNSYYDRTKNPTNQCGSTLPSIADFFGTIYAAAGDGGSVEEIMALLPGLASDSGSACAPVNASGNQNSYFKNTTTVAPLTSWDFTNVWHAHADDYPTFTADPNGWPEPTGPEDDVPPTTPNPDPKDDSPFIPKAPPTSKDVKDVIDKLTDLVPNEPLTEVLPNVVERVDAEVAGQADKPKDDGPTGIIPTILGVFSAFGAFLMDHIIEAMLILAFGAGLTYLGKKKKVLDHLHKNH